VGDGRRNPATNKKANGKNPICSLVGLKYQAHVSYTDAKRDKPKRENRNVQQPVSREPNQAKSLRRVCWETIRRKRSNLKGWRKTKVESGPHHDT